MDCFSGFFLGGGEGASGLSLWASDIFSLLAHCLVSKKVSVEHWDQVLSVLGVEVEVVAC